MPVMVININIIKFEPGEVGKGCLDRSNIDLVSQFIFREAA